ncbi:hypothetical protein BB559_000914 [Furculomyces boomerangus]|uniref:Aminoacyl-transfer RNA synthetases class-II family profile domain-containing protein n=2 Tax=Harpellales TaxID=61421 RepID=A0A2T9Z3N7_9FUNG|nr:hypothetical protein BB559_000914 [Furculomyces boomerangus]PVZ98314.1 hypothetical protein BB558_005684 [Smittium angustum]
MRSHSCGSLFKNDIGETVHLCGWVQHIRVVSSSLAFIKLRDGFGTIQLVFNKADLEKDSEINTGKDEKNSTCYYGASIFEALDKITPESVIRVSGKVHFQPQKDSTKNGTIEVRGHQIQILNIAKNIPFLPNNNKNMPKEMVRLENRHIDLRRHEMQKNIRTRAKIVRNVRNYMDSLGFLDIETPLLFKSTPEGAREFLVPTREGPGVCYALPQSPQQFKQLLMVSGFDRYYQIARCFRDEDLRADRQPEFTQVDIEMSFIEPKDIQAVIEGLMKVIWKEIKGVDLNTPFKRMTFYEATSKYGSDKPDTRFGLEIQQFDENSGVFPEEYTAEALVLKKSLFEFSKTEISEILKVANMSVEGGESKNVYAHFVGEDGVPKQATITSLVGRMLSKHGKEFTANTFKSLGLEPGDVVITSERLKMITKISTMFSLRILHWEEPEHSLAQCFFKKASILNYESMDNFLWVEEFPLFTIESQKDLDRKATHHPFTAPHSKLSQIELSKLILESTLEPNSKKELISKLAEVYGLHYDLVLNGVELGGGSIRIHDSNLQSIVFSEILNISENVKSRLQHLVSALGHGCPPHGGIALGLDRLVAILCNAKSLRDVIAFPKASDGHDLMLKSPAAATEAELKQYYLKPIV